MSEHEKEIQWLRAQVTNPETPPAIRRELERHLRAHRQRADDIFEDIAQDEMREAAASIDVRALNC